MTPVERLADLTSRAAVPVPISGRRARALLSAARRLPPGPPRTRTFRGVPLHLTCDGDAERLAYWFTGMVYTGFARSPLGTLLAQVIEPSTFIDVGANIAGYSTIAKAAGWQVVRVEPDPRLRAFHDRNPHLGAFHPVALGAEDGAAELVLSANRQNIGDSSLVAVADSVERVSVEVKAGDRLLDPHLDGVTAPLVKIDVEGAEAEVLAGIAALLPAHRPVVFCEVRGRPSTRAPSSDVQVAAVLHEHDYRVFEVADDGLRQWRGTTDRLVYDVIAVPGERAAGFTSWY